MSATEQTVAVLGAGGTMGRPMARNLARRGFSVRAWNRSRAKAESLSEDGATVFDSPAEAVEGASVVLTMLSDADAVLASMSEVRGDGMLWLQMSTIGVDGIERCAELADERGLVLVDAPVLGTKEPAEQGDLVILASGPERVRSRLDEIFEAIGKRTVWVGEAGAGSRLKVVTNTWIVTLVEGAAETLALAEALGIDPALFLDAVSGGPLDLPYLQTKGQAMIDRDFEPSFRLALAAKDAALAADAASRHDVDLPLLVTIRDRLAEGAREHPDADLAATYLTSSPRSRSANTNA